MIQIRQAQLQDIDQIAFLFDLYRIFYGKLGDPESCKNYIKARIVQNDALIFVACDHDKVIGFALNYWQFSSVSMNQFLILNDLYVMEEYRNRGIGKILIDAIKEICLEKNFKGIQLETGKNNEPGNHLYPKEGFKLIDYNFYFWQNPELV